MMTVATWTRVWCSVRPYMITMRVAPVVDSIRQAFHYRSLVIRDITERFVLMVKS